MQAARPFVVLAARLPLAATASGRGMATCPLWPGEGAGGAGWLGAWAGLPPAVHAHHWLLCCDAHAGGGPASPAAQARGQGSGVSMAGKAQWPEQVGRDGSGAWHGGVEPPPSRSM